VVRDRGDAQTGTVRIVERSQEWLTLPYPPVTDLGEGCGVGFDQTHKARRTAMW